MRMKIPMYIKLMVIMLTSSVIATGCGYSVKWQDATAHNPTVEVGVVATTVKKNNLRIEEQPKAIREKPLALPKESDTSVATAKKITVDSWESLNPGFLLLAPLLGVSIAVILDVIDRVAGSRRRRKRAKEESEKTIPEELS